MDDTEIFIEEVSVSYDGVDKDGDAADVMDVEEIMAAEVNKNDAEEKGNDGVDNDGGQGVHNEPSEESETLLQLHEDPGEPDRKRSIEDNEEPLPTLPLKRARTAYFIFAEEKREEVKQQV